MTKNSILVLSGGQTTSLQDRGRYGYQDKGIPPSGIINSNEMRIANKLVGNKEETEVLEIFFNGPTIEINSDYLAIALVSCRWSYLNILNKNKMIRSGRSVILERGDKVKIILSKSSIVSILAVSGGFDIFDFMNSKSTNPITSLGGFEGGFLKDNMLLKLKRSFKKSELKTKILTHSFCMEKVNFLRIILGPHKEYFLESIIKKFLSTKWIITKDINRMGIRLEGEGLGLNIAKDILSDGNQNGSIQIAHNGKPIILLPDRGTTGGYPKIATIISADFHLLSKLQIGQRLSFKETSLYNADLALRKNDNKLLKSLFSIKDII